MFNNCGLLKPVVYQRKSEWFKNFIPVGWFY